MTAISNKMHMKTQSTETPGKRLAPRVDWSEMSDTSHFVQFYETDDFLLDSLTEFVAAGLAAGDACIVISTQAHREGLAERLKASGQDVTRADYISLDAVETLSLFMVDGMPDAERFIEVIGNVIARASKYHRNVRVFGDMVAVLWIEGNATAAIRLEELWNDLRSSHSFSLFCAYAIHNFASTKHETQFVEICRQHSQVIPDESYMALETPDERLLAISLLQQKANTLEAEIAERRAAEAQLRVMEQRKDEFISMASHELKTPVTSLKGFLSLLQRRLNAQEDKKSLHYLARMDAQVNKLIRLINDLLDISKMQTGQLEYRLERFSLDALARDRGKHARNHADASRPA